MQTLPKSEMARLAFHLQPWMSPGLPPLMLTVEKFRDLVFVHHVSNVVPTSTEAPFDFYGNSVWVATTEDRRCVAVCFDWKEIAPSVVAINDPLSISSNAYLVDDEGQLIDDFGRWHILMQALQTFDWQAAAVEHLASETEERLNPKLACSSSEETVNLPKSFVL